MPLFYFIPYNFFKDRKKAPMVEMEASDIVIYGVVATIALLMFIGLIVIPAMMLVNQNLPPVQVQAPF